MLKRLLHFNLSVFMLALMGIARAVQKIIGKKKEATLVVLTYHSVHLHQRAKFAEQMNLLVRVGKPVFANIDSDTLDGTHYIAVTFDDGYHNFIENALPILLEREIPVTAFIPPRYLGAYPGWITNQNHENKSEILMTEEQIKNLDQTRVRIGSHSYSHLRLTALPTEQVRSELSESKTILEELLGKAVDMLSFPYNDYDDTTVQTAREVGYSRVFSNVPSYPISNVNRFLQGRVDVTPDDWTLEFWMKLKGAYQWLPFAVKCKRMIKGMIPLWGKM